MDVTAKLPTMPDDALGNLHANAKRLGTAGTPAQRASASALLPAIEAELTARRAAARERLAQKARSSPKRRASAAATAAAASASAEAEAQPPS